MLNQLEIKPHLIQWEAITSFAKNNFLRNRTIVSNDCNPLIDELEKEFDLNIFRHSYKTGEEHGTWKVPKSWNIKSAFLKDSSGNIIASYDEHPLFVAPYSSSINRKISKEELRNHVTISKNQPNAFSYNYRLAFDPNLSLKEWHITLPKNRWDALTESETYHIFIDTEVFDSEMIVGEITIEGESKETIALLADYCHPGQINDSFSGLVMFVDFMKYLKSLKSKLHYTYSLLIMPETIGSSVYLASKSQGDKNIVASIFSDDIGDGEDWYIKLTREENTYLDEVAKECTNKFKDLKLAQFNNIIGNDEHVFDSPQAKIPSLSIQKYPFIEYHTSNDDMNLLKKENIQKASDIMSYILKILETDQIFGYIHNVPFHMSRFNLYSDYHFDNKGFVFNKKIMNSINSENTVLQISHKIKESYEDVFDFIFSMYDKNLLIKLDKNKILTK